MADKEEKQPFVVDNFFFFLLKRDERALFSPSIKAQ